MRKVVPLIAGLLLSAAPAQALVVAVPLTTLIDSAEVIAVGKVVRIEENAFARFQRSYDAAVVQIETVLKGPKLKEAKIGQPARGGIAISSDRRYQVGQEAVWILSRAQGLPEGVYEVGHPFAMQPLKEKEKVAKLVEEREKLPGGKPANGLVARAEIEMRGNVPSIKVSVKNVSDKAILISTYLGNRTLQLDWTGPDGKKREKDLYEFLQRVKLRPMNETDFATVPPGGVAQVGPGGAGAAIVLENAEPGEHKIKLTYTNKEDGKQFGLKNVWTGTAITNELTVTVK